jgi:hypothetical protein
MLRASRSNRSILSSAVTLRGEHLERERVSSQIVTVRAGL